MRRSLAAALLGVSLWVGSLAWTGFLMTRTVLDPGRSEAVADALLEDDAVREQLAANLAGGVQAALPAGAPVDDASIDAGARLALSSPAVEALVRDALVRTHQAFLGEGEVPRSIEGPAVGASAREALVAERPDLAPVLPDAPVLSVPLPTERVPDAGPVRRGLVAAVPVLAAVAAAGAVLALVVTTDRPRVLRRAGFWAIGLSAVVLAVAFGVPALADDVAPDQAAVIAALARALAASAQLPALVLAASGASAVLLSLVWRAAPALTTGAAEAPPVPVRQRSAARAPRRDLPRPGRRPAPALPPRATPASRPVAAPVGDVTRVQDGGVDRTVAERADAEPARPRRGARWVDGVGWVHEGPEPVPSGARWVAGVGYVLPD